MTNITTTGEKILVHLFSMEVSYLQEWGGGGVLLETVLVILGSRQQRREENTHSN